MFGIGIGEILIIFVIFILLFGDKNLSSHLRTFFIFLAKSKKTLKEVQNSVYEAQDELERSLKLAEARLELSQKSLSKTPLSWEDDEAHLNQTLTPQDILAHVQKDLEKSDLEKRDLKEKSLEGQKELEKKEAQTKDLEDQV
jgi:Sec-independent protein translocase protein TatA